MFRHKLTHSNIPKSLTEDQEQESEGEYLHEQFMKAYQETARMQAETNGFDHDIQDVHRGIQKMDTIERQRKEKASRELAIKDMPKIRRISNDKDAREFIRE
jgi:hypothetical protein